MKYSDSFKAMWVQIGMYEWKGKMREVGGGGGGGGGGRGGAL